MQIKTALFKPPALICTIPSLLDKNRIQISLLDKLKKLKISLKVTQYFSNKILKLQLESFKAQFWGILMLGLAMYYFS
jgi:hypothetical protein